MEPMTVRVLLAMQLSPEQRGKLRRHERSLPAGRYLQGYEICRLFNLKPSPATEQDTAMLDDLWKQYERRILWKVNQIEQKRHDERCGGFAGWCKCRTKQEEIHEWEDWALENFGRMIEEITWSIPTAILVRVQGESERDSSFHSSPTYATQIQESA